MNQSYIGRIGPLPPLIPGTEIYDTLQVTNFRAEGNVFLKNIVADNLIVKTSPITINNAQDVTYTGQQMIAGIIKRNPNGASRTDTTATASSIISELSALSTNVLLNYAFTLTIENTSLTVGETITILGGTGVTIENGIIIDPASSVYLQILITQVTTGSEAVSIFNLSGPPIPVITPGGVNTNIQFNDTGAFGGTNNFTFNKLTNVVTLAGTLTGLSTPVSSTDATNKSYVDNAITGLRWKNPVTAASTANVPTLSGLLTIDGVVLTAGDRVLLKNQTSGIQNGIYIAAVGSWSRSSDMSTGSDAASASMYVTQGTVNGTFAFTCTNITGSAVVGTNSLTFIIFNNSGTGDVVGTAISTNNAIVRWDTTTGKLIKNSGVLLSDTQDITGVNTLGLVDSTTNFFTMKAASTTTSYTVTMPSSQGAASTYLQNNGSGTLSWATAGNVTGPASSVNTAIALFNGTTGKILQNSVVTVTSGGAMAGVVSLALKGTTNSLTILPAAGTAAYSLTMPSSQGAASTYLQNNGSGTLSWATAGDVAGPASSVNTAVALFSGTSGKVLQNSVVTVTSGGAMAGVVSLALKGTTNSLTILPAAGTAAYSLTMPSSQGAASTYLQNNGSGTLSWATAGDVTGPASSTSTAIALFNGSTGKVLQNSVVTITSGGAMAGVVSLAIKGTTNSITISPVAGTAAYSLILPSAQGSASTYLQNDGLGNLSWVTAGNVSGPASSVNTAVALFSGTSGKVLQNSTVLIDPVGAMTGVSSLALKGTTNSITISPATSTAAYSLTLPNAQGASNTFLRNDGAGGLTWAAAGVVAGSNTNVQFNDSGVLGGVSSFSYDKLTNILTVGTVTGLSNPSNSTDAANKQYVDSISAGLKYKSPANVASTANIATLSGLLTIDGITLVAGNRVLVKDQTTGVQNGIYVAAVGAWSRSSDLAAGSDASGAVIFIISGTVNGGYSFICNNASGSATVGTNSLTFVTYTTGQNGNVLGPAVSTNNAIALYNGTSGKNIQNSVVTITSGGAISDAASLALKGTLNSITILPSAVTTAYSITLPSTQGSANTFLQNNGSGTLLWALAGDVYGPAGATSNALARYNLTTGKILKDSLVTLSDTGDLAGVKTFTLNGSVSGTLTIQPDSTTVNYTVTMPSLQGSANTYLKNNGSGLLTWASAGNVSGPGTSTTNAIPIYTDTTGTVLSNSSLLFSSGNLYGANSITILGTSGNLTLQPSATTTSYTLTMPAGQGSANTYLKNDGLGTLSWSTAGTVTGPISSIDTAIPRFSGTSGQVLQNSGVTINSTNDIAGASSISLAGTTNSVKIMPASATAAYNITLPAAQGAVGTFLQNDGSGGLSWGDTAPIATNLGGTSAFTVPYQSASSTTSYLTFQQLNALITAPPTLGSGTLTIYVNNYWGSDTYNGTTPQTAVATIGKALTLVTSGGIISILGSSTAYNENLTITTPNITIMSDSYNNLIVLSGTLTISNTTGIISMKGISIANIVHNSSGSLYLFNCAVTASLVTSSTGSFRAYQSDIQNAGSTTISITGAGAKTFGSDCYLGNTTINSSGATVRISNVPSCLQITLTQGTLILTDSTVYSPSNLLNALSTSSGSVVYIDNVKFLLTNTNSPAQISIPVGALYSEINSNRTLSSPVVGTNIYRISYSDANYAQNYFIKGSTSGYVNLVAPATPSSYNIIFPSSQGSANTTLINNGSGTLTWGVSGSVTGPGSSTDTALVRFSGTSGSILQDSTVLLSGAGAMTGVTSLALKGTTNSVTISPASATTAYALTMPASQGSANTTLINNGSGTLTWGVSGSVTGPLSSTDTALVRFNGTTGSILQDSTVLVSNAGAMTGVTSLALKGTTNSVTISPASATTAYALTMPSTQGSANTFLRNDGLGGLSWTSGGTGNVSCNATPVIDTQIPVFSGTSGTLLTNSIVTIDTSGNVSKIKQINLDGATSGTLSLKPAATTTSYTLTNPGAQGSANTFMVNDGSGNLNWSTITTNSGVVSNVTQMNMNGATSGTLSMKPAATTTSYTLTNPGAQGSANTFMVNDGSGNLNWSTITTNSGIVSNVTQMNMNGATSGTLSLKPAATTTSHTVTMPSAQGSASSYLLNDGSGNLNWSPVYSSATGANFMLSFAGTAQNVYTNPTFITVDWNRTPTVFDPLSMWSASDPTKIYIKVAGTYQITATVNLTNVPGGIYMIAFKNGSTGWASNDAWARAGGFNACTNHLQTTVTLATGDYVTVQLTMDQPGVGLLNSGTISVSLANGYSYNAPSTITTTGQTGSMLDRLVNFNPPSNNSIGYTLPDPSLSTANTTTITYQIRATAAGTRPFVVLNAPSGKTINSVSSYNLVGRGSFVTVNSNGSDWAVVGESARGSAADAFSNGDQLMNANTNLDFSSNAQVYGPNIELAANGTFKLFGGVTYQFLLLPRIVGGSGTGNCGYGICDATTGAVLNNMEVANVQNTDVRLGVYNAPLQGIYTPAVDQTVAVRSTSGSSAGNQTMWNSSRLTITTLNGAPSSATTFVTPDGTARDTNIVSTSPSKTYKTLTVDFTTTCTGSGYTQVLSAAVTNSNVLYIHPTSGGSIAKSGFDITPLPYVDPGDVTYSINYTIGATGLKIRVGNGFSLANNGQTFTGRFTLTYLPV